MNDDDLRPVPASGRCCESPLRLARDLTEYSTVELIEGRWVVNFSGTESGIHGPDSVRLFCSDCGDYFEVPKEFEE